MRVEHSIYIGAPVETVWSVTQDVERWPEWTPTVTSVQLVGERVLRVGATARIKQPLQPESEWLVTDYIPGNRFSWETTRLGLRIVATHELSEEQGGTRNVLTVNATGPVAVLLWPVLRLAMQKALSDENAGLKRHCEGDHAARAR